jgi:small subunit ribosomal protein S21
MDRAGSVVREWHGRKSFSSVQLSWQQPDLMEVGEFMPEIIVKKGEPIDRALKRLKSKLDAEGLMDEVRRLRAFETPTQRSRRKAKNNAKRAKMKIRFNFNPAS